VRGRLTGPTVVLDCRWLGISGAGRTTELVLRGLAAAPPGGRWVLWGPEPATTTLAWPGAEVRPIAADPRLLAGQRHAFAVPQGDFHVFMHQQRPLRNLPAVTFVYDTIPLRYGAPWGTRALKQAFLRRIGRTSRQIVTISEFSRSCIVRELGVPAERVEILRFPFDDAFVDRVLALRKSEPREDTALFVGAFLPHKNVPRLLSAFSRTGFARDGGRLVLVVATPGQAERLSESLDDGQRALVSVHHSCSQAQIDRLYATSLFLVQPSLEEGFGLPAWEALCCGLPVCVSDGGALPEVTAGFAEPFPARSVPAMAAALDACAERARAMDLDAALAQAALLRDRGTSVAEYGTRFGAIVAGNL
jgi:glycosyltransferase involved in cell wall biosynthesis